MDVLIDEVPSSSAAATTSSSNISEDLVNDNSNNQEDVVDSRRRKRKGASIAQEEEKVPVVPTVDKRITVPLEQYVDILLTDRNEPIRCHAPGCTKEFETSMAYNDHYMARHLFKCDVCRKSLPGSHFLELHVLENHDSFFEVMAERKPMYSCLDEECKLKFMSSQERFTHVLEEHKRHHLFNMFKHFEEISTTSKHRRKGSNKNKKNNSTAVMDVDQTGEDDSSAPDTMQTEDTTSGNEVPEAAGATVGIKKKTSQPQKNKKPPADITFGHHVPKFKYWNKKVVSDTERASVVKEDPMDMSAIKESLDSAETTTGLEN